MPKTTPRFRLHKDDKKVLVNFIDYSRLRLPEDVDLEIAARYLCQRLQINPDISNGRIASKFASLLDRNKIICKGYA